MSILPRVDGIGWSGRRRAFRRFGLRFIIKPRTIRISGGESRGGNVVVRATPSGASSSSRGWARPPARGVCMTRHPRLPALIVLVVATSLGALYLVAWGQVEKYWKGGNQNLDALRKQVEAEGKAGTVSAQTWLAYADALANAKRFAAASDAYKEVISLQPGKRDAKFQCGLALAQAGASGPFY